MNTYPWTNPTTWNYILVSSDVEAHMYQRGYLDPVNMDDINYIRIECVTDIIIKKQNELKS